MDKILTIGVFIMAMYTLYAVTVGGHLFIG